MLTAFMRSPLPNSLAVLTLLALVVTWFSSLMLSANSGAVDTNRGWFSKLLPAFSILGIPAALDLLQTSGLALILAEVVLTVFLLMVVGPILQLSGRRSLSLGIEWYRWCIPIAVIGGLAVAGYLTFVESTGGQVACGPSGGCATVQNSRYAVLFGVLPVGVLGLSGYTGIGIAWLIQELGPRAVRKPASLAIWGMGLFGVLFSIYLTFLEPFVIGATCMWCISSAVLMIVILLAITPAAQRALAGEAADVDEEAGAEEG